MNNEKETLSIAEAARLWGCSKLSAANTINEGKRMGMFEKIINEKGAARITKADAIAFHNAANAGEE